MTKRAPRLRRNLYGDHIASLQSSWPISVATWGVAADSWGVPLVGYNTTSNSASAVTATLGPYQAFFQPGRAIQRLSVHRADFGQLLARLFVFRHRSRRPHHHRCPRLTNDAVIFSANVNTYGMPSDQNFATPLALSAEIAWTLRSAMERMAMTVMTALPSPHGLRSSLLIN